jgi:hypothetical protein
MAKENLAQRDLPRNHSEIAPLSVMKPGRFGCGPSAKARLDLM